MGRLGTQKVAGAAAPSGRPRPVATSPLPSDRGRSKEGPDYAHSSDGPNVPGVDITPRDPGTITLLPEWRSSPWYGWPRLPGWPAAIRGRLVMMTWGAAGGGSGPITGASTAGDLDAGVGWDTIVQRAHDALADVPDEAVLGGFSMGVGRRGGVARAASSGGCLSSARTDARAVGPAYGHTGAATRGGKRPVRSTRSDGRVPGQRRAGRRGRVGSPIPGVGHFFTDVTLPEHDAAATASAWNHVPSLLDALD
jgi:hypothetical protein